MALSAARSTQRQFGTPFVHGYNLLQKGATTIWQGALVVFNAGYAAPATAVVSLISAGVAQETIVNGGADGTKTVRVERGAFKFFNSGGDAVVQADVGKDCYIVDDQTVCHTAGTSSIAGKVIALDDAAASVWVEIGRF
jgi:hypothetical protein